MARTESAQVRRILQKPVTPDRRRPTVPSVAWRVPVSPRMAGPLPHRVAEPALGRCPAAAQHRHPVPQPGPPGPRLVRRPAGRALHPLRRADLDARFPGLLDAVLQAAALTPPGPRQSSVGDAAANDTPAVMAPAPPPLGGLPAGVR